MSIDILNLKHPKTNRNFHNSYIIIRIRYKKEISGILVDKEEDLDLYRQENIEKAFNRFTTRNSITRYNNKKKYFYLIKNNEYILLDKKILIKDLGLNSGDKVEVLTAEKSMETNGDFIYDIRKNPKQKFHIRKKIA